MEIGVWGKCRCWIRIRSGIGVEKMKGEIGRFRIRVDAEQERSRIKRFIDVISTATLRQPHTLLA